MLKNAQGHKHTFLTIIQKIVIDHNHDLLIYTEMLIYQNLKSKC